MVTEGSKPVELRIVSKGLFVTLVVRRTNPAGWKCWWKGNNGGKLSESISLFCPSLASLEWLRKSQEDYRVHPTT